MNAFTSTYSAEANLDFAEVKLRKERAGAKSVPLNNRKD